jgi:N-methylhydantoinase B
VSWNRLISFVNEAAAALVRTAFSPIIRESHDYACVLFDATGKSVAQSSTSVPSFIGTLPNTMRHILAKYGRDQWNPGDVAITNDPWIGSGHLQDISMVAPVFRSGRLVAFAGVVAHPPDMGGKWSPECQEIYEEGLQIPICKLMRAGEPNEDVFDFIRHNVRVADQVLGDIHAMISSCSVAGRRLVQFMDEVGLDEIDGLAAAIHERSEQAMRQRVEAIPDGKYAYAFEIDGYEDPLKICCELRIEGSDLTIDYAGSSSQVRRAINCPWVYTNAYTVYPLKCALHPEAPNNEGLLRPFKVLAPKGSIVDPLFPAAVGARHLTGHLLPSAVFGALAQALPPDALADRILADSASPRPHLMVTGRNDAGRDFSVAIFMMGGMGARPNKDGLPCIAFPSTTRNVPIEVLESSAPIVIEEKSLRVDSGGAGAFEGGEGQVVSIRILARDGANLGIFTDRAVFPPRGLKGGEAGAAARVFLNGKPLHPKSTARAKTGDLVTVLTPGGGGFGLPADRALAAIQADVEAGLLSPDAAKARYPQFTSSG